MNAAAIEYIWKAIQESERSDEFPFMDDEKADQPGAVSRQPITEVARSV